MAKKGQQQLQTELNTDEDLENFLQRSGLIVIDVYSEWCGPCQGMISALRKIKFEMAGDSLQLAIAKSDTISYFKRFQRKSEPTWLFFVNGRAVNIAFGCNIPKLSKLIMNELSLIGAKNRKNYRPDELFPVEVEKVRAIEQAAAVAAAKEAADKAQKRCEYLTYVTDMIMENMPDIAVTIFGTQVDRDMYKVVVGPADKMKLQCKDRKFTNITKQQFETIFYDCGNPMPEDVQEIYNNEEAWVCFWKLPEGGNFKILQYYEHELTKPREEKDEDGDLIKLPPILKKAKIKIQIELEEGEEWVEEPDIDSEEQAELEEQARLAAEKAKTAPEPEKEETEMMGEEEEEEEEGADDATAPPPLEAPPIDMADAGMDMFDEGEEEQLDEAEFAPIRYKTKIVRMPPIWIPNNHRTHAALIYVMFRNQTLPFLPPDPVPDPPHIIMTFETYKKRDLISIAKRNKAQIRYYGFFTSDDPYEAELLANSLEKYDKSPNKSYNDKLVMRVNKVTSNMMLTLATYSPSYVSPNTQLGFEEAKLFFPESFKTESAELLETIEATKEEKEKKTKAVADEAAMHAAVAVEAQEEKERDAEMGYDGLPIDDDVDMEGEYTMFAEEMTAGEGETPTEEGAPAGAPPAEAPPAEAPPAEAPPAEAPPAEAPTAEAPPSEAPPAEPTQAESPPAEAPTAEAPAESQPADSPPAGDPTE